MTDFSVNEDQLFMGLLKRRAYMLAFPNEPTAAADAIQIEVEYNDDGCCGHDLLRFYVRGTGDGKHYRKLGHCDLATFLADFFGVEDA